jgi:hypothetical protein
MKLVKHNVIENYVGFSDDERIEIIVQEISKCLMMFPNAVADIFDACKIKYQNKNPKELQKVIEQNASDLKMINKLVKLSLVANEELQKANGGDVSVLNYRKIMSNKDEFFKENKDIVQDAVLKLREFLKSKQTANFTKEVNEYLNLDGANFDDKFVSSIDSNKNNLLTKFLIVGVLGIGIYYLTKK